MKNIFKISILLLLILTLLVPFFSCDNEEEPTPEDPTLPEENENIEEEIKKIDLKSVRFSDMSYKYDGKEKKIEIRGTLPDGVEVRYENNDVINAGEYTVVAKFYYKNTYLEGKDKTAKLTIEKASIGIGAIKISETVFAYDGNEKNIEFSNIPRGVTLNVTGNGKVEIGVYRVKVEYEYDRQNYLEVEPTYYVMTITPGEFTTEGLEFTKLDNGSYEISAYTGDESYVVIPKKHTDGIAISSIGTGAFEGNTKLTYVYMPETIYNIGAYAFRGCTSLDTLLLSQSLTTVGEEAFADTAIDELHLPKTVTAIGNGALKGTDLKSLTLPFVGGSKTTSNNCFAYVFGATGYMGGNELVPESLKTVSILGGRIAEYAFFGLKNIETVALCNGVEAIGVHAFEGCESLRDIYIAASVVEISAAYTVEYAPFYGCSADLMIVLEADSDEGFGEYWSKVSKDEEAFIIYLKSYEDFLENKDGYRTADHTKATITAITFNGKLLDGFSENTTSYTYQLDANDDYPKVKVLSASSSASVFITYPTAQNGRRLTIRSLSQDRTEEVTYYVDFFLKDGFNTKAEVIMKDGKRGTVTYVIDDGIEASAKSAVAFQEIYGNLKFTFAIPTTKFADLITVKDKESGKLMYLMDGNRYAYQRYEAAIETWLGFIVGANGQYNEIASHTHTSEFWGYNDDGGEMRYLDSANVDTAKVITDLFPVGSVRKEFYASSQILKEIFGEYENQYGTAMIKPGIATNRTPANKDGEYFPSCYPAYEDAMLKAVLEGSYVGSRTTSGAIVTEASDLKELEDRIDVPSYMIFSSDRGNGANSTVEQWKDYIDRALAVGGWATFCLHNVCQDGAYYNLDEEYANELFSYTDRDDVWVAGWTEAMVYYCQWSSAKCDGKLVNEGVSLILKDNENNELFHDPLTVKIYIPTIWETAYHNGEELTIMKDEYGFSFVYVNAIPDTEEVLITELR